MQSETLHVIAQDIANNWSHPEERAVAYQAAAEALKTTIAILPTQPADSAGPPYASGNWDIQGYKSPAEEIDDMANVGRSLIEHIASVVSSDGPFKGWTPADDPAEIVSDMANWIADMSRPSDWFAGDVDADGNEIVTVPAHHIAAQDAKIARLRVALDEVATRAGVARLFLDPDVENDRTDAALADIIICARAALTPETGHD